MPSYFNSFITKNDTKLQKQQSLKSKSTKNKILNNKDSEQQTLLQNFNSKNTLPISFNSQTGKLLVDILGIPTEDSISTPLQIRNILEVGEDPLTTFEAQGSSNFPQKNGLSQQILYNLKTSEKTFQQAKKLEKSYDINLENGYKDNNNKLSEQAGIRS